MMNDWTSMLLLAQEAAPEDAPPPLPGILIYIIPIMVVWYVMFIRPQNKERSSRQDMLKSLKKNDSVVTIGGIIGTVSHISEDGKEVTLRVDDNTRLKFQRDAVRDVLRKDSLPPS
jgi:preprotein translocase subunit YajC